MLVAVFVFVAVVVVGFLLLVVLMCCDAHTLCRGLFVSFSWNRKNHHLVARTKHGESAHTGATDKADQRDLRCHRLHSDATCSFRKSAPLIHVVDHFSSNIRPRRTVLSKFGENCSSKRFEQTLMWTTRLHFLRADSS